VAQAVKVGEKMDKLTALALAHDAIRFLLSEVDVLPGEFLRAELEQAAAALEALAADLEPARKQAIRDTLSAVDARKRGEISPAMLEFFKRI
jgi:hypothetical protein